MLLWTPPRALGLRFLEARAFSLALAHGVWTNAEGRVCGLAGGTLKVCLVPGCRGRGALDAEKRGVSGHLRGCVSLVAL